MKRIRNIPALIIFLILFCFRVAHAFDPMDIESGDAFAKTKSSFKNFIRCEMTRSDASEYFDGKHFEIIVVNLFDAVYEGDILIVTGSVKCFVDEQYKMLYLAVGLKDLLGKEKVFYYVYRDTDFQILATELMKFPYKNRCTWDRYWIDLK